MASPSDSPRRSPVSVPPARQLLQRLLHRRAQRHLHLRHLRKARRRVVGEIEETRPDAFAPRTHDRDRRRSPRRAERADRRPERLDARRFRVVFGADIMLY